MNLKQFAAACAAMLALAVTISKIFA